MSKTIRDAFRNAGREDGYSSEEWKRFAREMRRAKGNFCECCKQGNIPTQVHHLFYEEGRKLWDYKFDEVIVLCAPCHHELHAELQNFRKAVFGNLDPKAFRVLNGALAVAFKQYNPLVFAHALAEFVASPSMIQRFADAWGGVVAKAPSLGNVPQGSRAQAIIEQLKNQA